MVCWKMPNFFKWANTAPISQVSGGTGAVQKVPLSHPPSPRTPRRALPRARPQGPWRAERTRST